MSKAQNDALTTVLIVKGLSIIPMAVAVAFMLNGPVHQPVAFWGILFSVALRYVAFGIKDFNDLELTTRDKIGVALGTLILVIYTIGN